MLRLRAAAAREATASATCKRFSTPYSASSPAGQVQASRLARAARRVVRRSSRATAPLEEVLRPIKSKASRGCSFSARTSLAASRGRNGPAKHSKRSHSSTPVTRTASSPACSSSARPRWSSTGWRRRRSLRRLKVVALQAGRHQHFEDLAKSDLVITNMRSSDATRSGIASWSSTRSCSTAQHIKNRQTQNALAVKPKLRRPSARAHGHADGEFGARPLEHH